MTAQIGSRKFEEFLQSVATSSADGIRRRLASTCPDRRARAEHTAPPLLLLARGGT